MLHDALMQLNSITTSKPPTSGMRSSADAPLVFLDGPLVDAAREVQDLAADGGLPRVHVPDEHHVQVVPAREGRTVSPRCPHNRNDALQHKFCVPRGIRWGIIYLLNKSVVC